MGSSPIFLSHFPLVIHSVQEDREIGLDPISLPPHFENSRKSGLDTEGEIGLDPISIFPIPILINPDAIHASRKK